jgi:subtilisin-like proprotein convertase family protein
MSKKESKLAFQLFKTINKRIMKPYLFLIFFIFGLIGNAQNAQQAQEIIKEYDLNAIKQLQNKIKTLEDKDKAFAIETANKNGWPIRTVLENGGVEELIKIGPKGFPIYRRTDNVDAAVSTRTNFINSGGNLGLNIDGQGMVARVWDGGTVRRTHNGFGSRVQTVDDASGITYSDHATHVTGTIIAAPWSVASENIKGMAPLASAKTFNWTNDESEALSEAALGMLVSNHSYGVAVAASVPAWYIGSYVDSSRDWDQIAYSAPFYLPVFSAGNDGNNNLNSEPIAVGYDKLIGDKVAKNVLTVANSSDAIIFPDGTLASVTLSSDSSQGPTDDRRIKPDIAGNGQGLTSLTALNNTSINTFSGTSMAAPNVSGTLLLLQQYHYSLHNVFMKAATLKGLACHTADDAGNAGPDPRFGWGLLNAKKAAETIRDNGLNSWVSENVLNQGQSYTITASSSGGPNNPLIASITWTDLPGVANDGTRLPNDLTKALVNDLDIRVTNGSTTHYPWKLQSNPSDLALRTGDNNVDNVEVIKIDAPTAGDYTITISHKGNLNTGSQNYSLVITGASSSIAITSKSPDVVACSNQNAVYTFDYKQIGTTTTNFTPLGLPAGATATIAPLSLSANGVVTMTISNISAVQPGIYDIGIQASNGTETETRFKKLTVYSTSFEPIALLTPANNAISIGSSVALDWSSNFNSESYNLQVSTRQDFNSFHTNINLTDSRYLLTNLASETRYYWRVIPSNRCNAALNAVAQTFSTGIITCNLVFSATDFSNAAIDVVANTTASVPIVVSGGITVADLNVALNITHTWIGDMIITLSGPVSIGRPQIVLFNQPCIGTGPTYPDIQATLDDSGLTISCAEVSPVVSGTIRPFESLSSINGLIADGTWTLNVLDVGNQDGGTINSVSLNFCKVTPSALSSSTNVLNSLRVYPNPTNEIINIDLGDVTGETTYELFDVQGRKVNSKVSSTNFVTLNVENLSEGIYMLKIQNGSDKTTKKVVINK